MSALLNTSQTVTLALRGELDCLQIRHALFSADLLLQGAQLLHYAPQGEDNWLWLSALAEYKKGVSVRGGIPLCWPWFGNAAMNPEAVKAFISTPEQAPAHGFARGQVWSLAEVYEDEEEVVLTLSLSESAHPLWHANLTADAEFRFTASSVSLVLTTHNQGATATTFSQALHSYFPTSDISATRLSGLEGSTYIDTLDGWQSKTQAGDVTFTAETDRIYYGEENISLLTPEHSTELSSQGSNSCVVWNPWTEKSLRLSQFAADDFKRMFCVETANALDDAITLAPSESHSLSLLLTRV